MTSIEIVLSFSGVHLIQDALVQCASEGWRGKKDEAFTFWPFYKTLPLGEAQCSNKSPLKK